MAHEWITAATALRYLSGDTYTYNQQRAICERAHSGLIVAQAETLLWSDERRQRCIIPKEFWWAEGDAALSQDWETGQFSTWIDERIEVKAFGVSFDFPGITEMTPAAKRAEGMRRISVSGDSDWIVGKELIRLIYAQKSPPRAGDLIIEACALGQLAARAMRATGVCWGKGGYAKTHEWAAVEWDVPLWFWREYLRANQSRQEWSLSKVKGSGVRDGVSETIQLHGVHIHRSGLPFIDLKDEPPSEGDDAVGQRSNRGRKAKYDWAAACIAVYGLIERGDLKPEIQADIEKALIHELSDGDEGPSESTVRPFAKRIWEESRKA